MNKFSILVSLVLSLSSCASAPNPTLKAATMGGLVATGIGAGVGAIVGSAINNGDIGKSAVLGAGIGLAAGSVIGASYQHLKEKATISANNSQIEANARDIALTNREMAEVRESLDQELREMDVDPESADYLYTGVTLGNNQ